MEKSVDYWSEESPNKNIVDELESSTSVNDGHLFTEMVYYLLK